MANLVDNSTEQLDRTRSLGSQTRGPPSGLSTRSNPAEAAFVFALLTFRYFENYY